MYLMHVNEILSKDFHQNLMDIEAYQRSETAAYLYTQGELNAVQRR